MLGRLIKVFLIQWFVSICLIATSLCVPAQVAASASASSLPNNTWYFAEGTTRSGFDEWLTIQNPGDKSARVTITLMMADGYNMDKIISVSSLSRTTLAVREIIGSDRDVSVRITSDKPVVAERPLYFDYEGSCDGGGCTLGATATNTTWYFPEGTTRSGFNEYICIQNPGEMEANVHLEYMTPGSVNYFSDVVAPPRSRVTVAPRDTMRTEEDIAVKLTSTQPVVAERPIYYDFGGAISGGDVVVGVSNSQKNWYFAEGCTTPNYWSYISIQNPGASEATVRIYYLKTDGMVVYNEYQVKANSRLTVDARRDVGDAEFSIVIDSTETVVAERVIYFINSDGIAGGHDVVGASAPGREIYFAEGTSIPGFYEWMCIMNPNNDPAHVTLDFQVEDGNPIKSVYAIGAHSRYTVNLNDTVGPGKNFSFKATSDAAVVVERPTYFIYGGRWRGGHCVIGYIP